MTENKKACGPDRTSLEDRSRRDFVALSAAAGLATVTRVASAADLPVVEKDVRIVTPDGTAEAVFVYPQTGSHPGVLIWTDAFGLRPVFREMAKRLAAQGYSVVVPNPFYRVAKTPVFADISAFDFESPTDRAKLMQLMNPLTASGAAEGDAKAYVAFLRDQPQVDRTKKIGVQGYCMGGALTVRSAAAVADQVGAGASFHGGGLVSDKPESPHLLAPKIHARMYFAIAANDDERQPDAKDKLREAFAAAKVPAEIEVYAGTLHGWCVPDMPMRKGVPVYNKADAERAWSKLLTLYREALA